MTKIAGVGVPYPIESILAPSGTNPWGKLRLASVSVLNALSHQRL
jgi:hypothetical protein